jgi:hypothetical protein
MWEHMGKYISNADVCPCAAESHASQLSVQLSWSNVSSLPLILIMVSFIGDIFQVGSDVRNAGPQALPPAC